jgi:hypothetical protein
MSGKTSVSKMGLVGVSKFLMAKVVPSNYPKQKEIKIEIISKPDTNTKQVGQPTNQFLCLGHSQPILCEKNPGHSAHPSYKNTSLVHATR